MSRTIKNLVASIQKKGFMRPHDWSISLQAAFTAAETTIGSLNVLSQGLEGINERVVQFTIPPSMSINIAEARSHYGIPRQVGNQRTPGTVTITVRVDGAMEILDYFRQWQDLIAPDTNLEIPTIGYYDSYATNSYIEYSNDYTGEVIRLEEVFPTDISPLQATHEPNATVLTADITLIYRTSVRKKTTPTESPNTGPKGGGSGGSTTESGPLISPYTIDVFYN